MFGERRSTGMRWKRTETAQPSINNSLIKVFRSTFLLPLDSESLHFQSYFSSSRISSKRNPLSVVEHMKSLSNLVKLCMCALRSQMPYWEGFQIDLPQLSSKYLHTNNPGDQVKICTEPWCDQYKLLIVFPIGQLKGLILRVLSTCHRTVFCPYIQDKITLFQLIGKRM